MAAALSHTHLARTHHSRTWTRARTRTRTRRRTRTRAAGRAWEGASSGVLGGRHCPGLLPLDASRISTAPLSSSCIVLSRIVIIPVPVPVPVAAPVAVAVPHTVTHTVAGSGAGAGVCVVVVGLCAKTSQPQSLSQRLGPSRPPQCPDRRRPFPHARLAGGSVGGSPSPSASLGPWRSVPGEYSRRGFSGRWGGWIFRDGHGGWEWEWEWKWKWKWKWELEWEWEWKWEWKWEWWEGTWIRRGGDFFPPGGVCGRFVGGKRGHRAGGQQSASHTGRCGRGNENRRGRKGWGR